jgi:HPt (histidine-containing phosphotransfer) domain-containing protein
MHDDVADFEAGPLQELMDVLPASGVAVLAQSYHASVALCFEKFDAAVPQRDWTTVSEQAHDLKGISGTFGAMRLQHIAADLEHLSFEHDFARVPAMLEAMKRAAAAAKAAIDKLVAANESKSAAA